MTYQIKQDSNVQRFLNACSYQKVDHVPAFEHYVMRNMMIEILGAEKMKEIVNSEEMMRMLYLYAGDGTADDFTIKGDKTTSELIDIMWEHDVTEWYSFLLPPKNNLELMKKLGIDCASPMVTWVPEVRDGSASTAHGQDGIVTGWDDLSKIDIPDRHVEKMLELVDWNIETFKGSGIGVGPICRSSFCNTYEVLGLQRFSLMLYDDLKLVEHIMDHFIDYSIAITNGLAEKEIDCFWLDDDVCMNTGFLVRPEFIEKLWLPRTDKMLQPLRDKNIPIFMHCCGNVKDLIPYAIELGITALQPIQPNCNDIVALRKKYDGKMTFVGNLDLAGVLSFGSPEEVKTQTKKLIDEVGAGGGYVVCSSHSITNDVPVANYMAMIETAQTYKAEA